MADSGEHEGIGVRSVQTRLSELLGGGPVVPGENVVPGSAEDQARGIESILDRLPDDESRREGFTLFTNALRTARAAERRKLRSGE